MIITKKQLRRRIEESRYIPAQLRDLVFADITAKKRWMWETELIMEEKYRRIEHNHSTSTFSKTIHHDCETHNTDHAL